MLSSSKGDVVLLSETSAKSMEKVWQRLRRKKSVATEPRRITWLGKPALSGVVRSPKGPGRRMIVFERTGRVYALLGYSPAMDPSHPSTSDTVLKGVKPYTGPLLPVMRPWVIKLIRLPKGQTVEYLDGCTPVPSLIPVVLRLNGVVLGTKFDEDKLVKCLERAR